MSYDLIDCQGRFEEAMAIINKSEIIALDTEFTRKITYFPILELIQIATKDGHIFLFDVRSKSIDWHDLLAVLKNDKVVKLIHSCSQDLEAISYRFNIALSSIIDTQIMASKLGHGKQCGYGKLVEEYFGVMVDKTDQYSKWSSRPLSQRQIDYAAMDVKYLIDLYEKMREKMTDDLFFFVSDESSSIDYKRKNSVPDVRHISKQFMRKHFLDQSNMLLIRNIMLLREELGVKHNKARNYIIDDIGILKIVKNAKKIDDIIGSIKKSKVVKDSAIIQLCRNASQPLSTPSE